MQLQVTAARPMKLRLIAGVVLVSLALLRDASGQDFVNLDFEAANLSAYGAGPALVPATNAIPGWTAYVGGNPQSNIFYNAISLGSTSISILGTNGVPSSLDGAFSIDLYGGVTATAASISQTGLVPANAVSIFFKAQYSGPPGGLLVVSIGGQNIPFFVIASGQNYTLYGGDVSAFAGQSEQLMFSAPEGNNNYWEIDDIVFSPSTVPEPIALGLFALGGLLLGLRRFIASN
jgi:hypothetical protein